MQDGQRSGALTWDLTTVVVIGIARTVMVIAWIAGIAMMAIAVMAIAVMAIAVMAIAVMVIAAMEVTDAAGGIAMVMPTASSTAL